ncbi:MAG: ferritin-like domain-containing protein [Deltaproteobacteria bacterium]|nr:ferritin-like domain-containing protein [Deltaproteobacteria bacterium]
MKSLRKKLRIWALATVPAAGLCAGCGKQTCAPIPPHTCLDRITYCTNSVVSSQQLSATGSLDIDTCKQLCFEGTVYFCESDARSDGNFDLTCFYDNTPGVGCLGTGRRPRGLVTPRRARARCEVGALLARVAHLEAASVPAFARLAEELTRFGAPKGLVERAQAARRDEIRHAAQMGRLARGHGASLAGVRVRQPARRSLEAFALENAVEGCVHETWGAMVAQVQAIRSPDSGVRSAMRRIATDEARHAELAWDVARWVESRLDPRARSRVRRAQRRAVDALDASLTSSTRAERALGLPDLPQARALHAKLRAELWSAA